jgi:predicted DCC family thiol-disulfide oxidoreductase YuxK
VSRTPILYDEDCGFCRTCLALVLAWDRRRQLRPVPLQDPEADRLLAGMPEERRMASWHLVAPAGEVRSAGAAFPPLLRLLPGGRPFAALAARFPRATERGYALVAANRSRFGRVVPGRAKRRADALIERLSRSDS